MRLPGGAIIGAAWNVAFPAINTDVSRTFHFDSDPLSQVLDALRSGTLEIYLNWGSTGGVTPWNADSRGAGAGILVTNEIANARGYLRSRCIVSNDPAPSNVAIGGAEPSLFAAPDPIHTRITFSAVKYRTKDLELQLLRGGTATVERNQVGSAQTAVNHDYSWTGTTGTNRRVGNGMFLGSEAKDLRVKMTSLDFGGDDEYVFAASGHAAGWVVDSNLQLTNASELTVDPQLYPRNKTPLATSPGALYHSQAQGNAFKDPPSSGDIANGQRLFPDTGFVSVRYLNARGEGVNSLTVTLKMWDSGSISSSEASPAHTFSGDTATRRSAAPATTPEAGWLPLAQSGIDRDKLPISWTTVVGGTWRVKSVLTAPSDLTGLENYSFSSGGETWNRNLFLVVVSPNYSPLCGVVKLTPSFEARHKEPADDLLIFAYMQDISQNGILVTLIPANEDSVTLDLTRVDPATGRLQYLDPTDNTWKGKANGGSIPSFTLIQASTYVAGGDPDVWVKAVSGVVAGNEVDFLIQGVIRKDGVSYAVTVNQEMVAAAINRHNQYAFDGPGFVGFPTR